MGDDDTIPRRKEVLFATYIVLLFLYMCGIMFQALGGAQLLIQRVCHDTQSTDCDSTAVSSKAAVWTLYTGLASSLTSVIAAGTYGVMSDRVGRKWIIVLPFIGSAASNASFAAFAYFHWPYWSLVAASAVTGIFGGSPTFFMAIYAAVADIIPESKRGARFGITEVALYLGIVGGTLSSGPIISYWEYQRPLWGVSALSLLLGGVASLLPETIADEHRATEFDWAKANVIGALAMLGKKTRLGRAPVLACLGLSFLMSYGAIIAFGSILILYTKVRFHWGPTQIGIFVAAQWTVRALCVSILSPFLLRTKSVPRIIQVVAIGLVVQTASMITYALAPSSPFMYLGTLIGGLSAVAFPAIRSLFSLAVPPDMQGMSFAALSACETVANILLPALASGLYAASSHDCLPCTLYVLAAFLAGGAGTACIAWAMLDPVPDLYGEPEDDKIVGVVDVQSVQISDQGPETTPLLQSARSDSHTRTGAPGR